MNFDLFLSVVIPAYNEEHRLQRTLPLLKDYLNRQDYSWEVVVVDDGSVDRTGEISGRFFNPGQVRVVRNERNRGKGFSVRRGVLEARGKFVLISDADFSSPIEEIEKLFLPLREGWDIAIGSRSLPNSNVVVHQAWYREGMGRCFNRMVQMLVLDGFIDTQCGFKCFFREKAAPIFSVMRVDGFSFDVEFLYLAKKRGLQVREVPVEWRHVEASRVRIWVDPINMFLDLLRIRWNDGLGRYKNE
ncbi:MAG: glycosyl transferase [Nitrospinae bacterium CG11_big_fil_rev_8_21_14_0_20_56_8]|nr:MAG: glycosyl transferase [Nitrospinae bacterium CG11_big_fil_rev_8_21_14_0_20_56_8]